MRTSLSSAGVQPWGTVLCRQAGSQHGSDVGLHVCETNRQANGVLFTLTQYLVKTAQLSDRVGPIMMPVFCLFVKFCLVHISLSVSDPPLCGWIGWITPCHCCSHGSKVSRELPAGSVPTTHPRSSQGSHLNPIQHQPHCHTCPLCKWDDEPWKPDVLIHNLPECHLLLQQPIAKLLGAKWTCLLTGLTGEEKDTLLLADRQKKDAGLNRRMGRCVYL